MKLNQWTEADLELLKGTFLFSGVSPERVKRAAEDARCRIGVFQKGEVIYDRTHFRKSLGVLLRGSVEVHKGGEDGRGLMLSILETGSLFGAAALFNETERYVTVLSARELTRIVFFPQELVSDLMQEDFRIVTNYMCFLSGRIRFLNDRIEGLAAGNAAGKLAFFLAGGTEQVRGTAEIRLNRSVTALAESLDLGRASLYRAFRELEEAGLIRQEGRTIYISDVEALRNL
ncbi:Crp/Fnr family transcriptional regulator [Papillibacter cinnamivorans]|uniref:Crp-like helix-turn-helix domain-containing protein n=1 Tax=Papillibacter cinnamivorans DSM 12816 TaxID=1122930 RepID=A0A1W2A3R2_9FIRM|nr:Crp/Fnr family transcriptional regulator [Papillibacter cinnamivorans]SMC55315.1 Crp-like helix-turn-helix domain-containing protein [Papillibacter cinnamivorans DSM 12816]